MSLSSQAQDLNKQIFDATRNLNILINECDRKTLVNFEEFKPTFDNFYRDYKVNEEKLAALQAIPMDYHITIVLGTWCGDSKYWVPNFLKLTDAIGIPEKQLKFVTVDGSKKTENGLLDGLNILKVPTFIVYNKENQEMGRIIEGPQDTLEAELLTILTPKK